MFENCKILLIEDDKKKIQDIKDFLFERYDYIKLVIKESYQTGLRELVLNNYDLLLLDMSIPIWDKKNYESDGDYQKFGGYLILKEIVRKKKPINTILITMFDDFGESDTSITLTQLDNLLKEEFSDMYFGAVFYSSREGKWKQELNILIEKVLC